MKTHAPQSPILSDIRRLITEAKQRVAVVVNAELTKLYWQIGQRIRDEILQGKRAKYGKQIVANLSKQLIADYGSGWSERHLWYCLRIAEIITHKKILHTLCSQLSWSHFRIILTINDPLKRDFYFELCRLEKWSVRQLQERIKSQLFERTAISKKPKITIQKELLELDKSGIHVAKYLTTLPPRKLLQSKLRSAINSAKQRISNKQDA